MRHNPAERPRPRGPGASNGRAPGAPTPERNRDPLAAAGSKPDRGGFGPVEHRASPDHWVSALVRRAYSEIAREPLPDTFQALVRRLTRETKGNGG